MQFYVRFISKQGQSVLTAHPVFFHLFCSDFCLFGFARGTSNERRESDCQFCCWRSLHSCFHLSLFPFLTGQQDRRNDLSHPIHADNCLLDPEANECWKEPPAYTFRDYRYSQHLLQNQAFAQQLSKTHGNWKADLFCLSSHSSLQSRHSQIIF